MEAVTPKTTPKTPRVGKIGGISDLHYDLNLYQDPPSYEVTLLEIEELVAERLKALEMVERLKERFKFLSDSYKSAFQRNIEEFPTYKAWGSTKYEYHYRRDLISHFMLRLACSMNVDLTQRFISRELDLFKIRFNYLPENLILRFFADNEINLDAVDTQERARFRNELSNGNRMTLDQVDSTTFYKLYFTECRELVRMRRVFLRGGYCYVTIKDLIQFLSQKYRLILSTSMNKQRTQKGQLDEDDRLLPILYRLVYKSSQSDEPTNASGRVIKPDQLDELSRVSFPMCMRTIHNRIRSDHHLRYFARQQYGLFLKGAGMPLEDSIAFFRQEFTKKIDIDKFDKNYVYNIRHMYGKEGNRVDHKPLNCPSIILNNPPGHGDCHGCPFRHSDSKVLEQRLQSMQIGKDRVDRIIKLTKEHRYDMACTHVFEYTHDMLEGDLGRVITSPNEYFDLSRDIKEGKRSKTAGSTQIIIQ